MIPNSEPHVFEFEFWIACLNRISENFLQFAFLTNGENCAIERKEGNMYDK